MTVPFVDDDLTDEFDGRVGATADADPTSHKMAAASGSGMVRGMSKAMAAGATTYSA